jgi:hypothetical protein
LTTRRTAALLAAASAMVPTVPAVAAIPVIARVNLTAARLDASTARLCWDGQVDTPPVVAGVWTVTIVGARTNPTVIAPPPVVASGATLPFGCTNLSNGGSAGSAQVDVTYAGAGADVTAACFMTLIWTTAAESPRPLHNTCTDTD